ncbi:MAG TPA: protein-glutamate O-methyltransferase CheR [Bacteroidales bacterium]|nr:protein-glutamate O-methyltransferase CheR [Bacteroidales bacterium]
MGYSAETLPLNDNVFRILRNLIMERTGIYFEDTRKDMLADKLSDRIVEKGYSSFIDYYYLLKYDESASSEWYTVFDLLSVKETYFWRETEHFESLTRHILPVIASSGNKTIRIWSAACSTGEEALSILMAIDHSGWLAKINVEVTGSDASRHAIEVARRGLYRDRSLRHLPEELRTKYFTRENDLWRVSPDLHRRIRWDVINLSIPDQVMAMPQQNVIFCRNVFIYFKDETIGKIVDCFRSVLSAPGYLFTGYSESLYRLRHGFELKEKGKSFVYEKNDN